MSPRSRKPKQVPRVTLAHIERAGGVVMHDRQRKRWLTTAGRLLRTASVEGLIDRGVLVPGLDGLFSGMHQTYRLRSAP